jgi:hypothetical protein
MATRYRILAWSPLTNQTQQSMDLANDTMLEDALYAGRIAASFAQRLNQNFFMHTSDWQGRTEAYEHADNPY